MGIPIQVVIPSRRLNCSGDDGLILSAYVFVVSLESGARTTDQWVVLVRLQSRSVCFIG